MISKNKKELLCKFVENTCEECKKEFDISELEIHRIRRGINGGTYDDFRNLKVVCSECHKMYHFGEFT